MKRISTERKTAVLAKLLPPYNMTVAAVAQMDGISEATLYNWRNKAKSEGKPVPGADKNTEQWPAEARFAAIVEMRQNQKHDTDCKHTDKNLTFLFAVLTVYLLTVCLFCLIWWCLNIVLRDTDVDDRAILAN